MKEKRRWFRLGLSAGIPICLGYFAVSFALGIAAREADMTALQATLMSFTCVTSTGEYAAITLIGSGAVYLEMAVTQAIVNMRYLLMSTALTQKLAPKTSFLHRLCLSYCMTDELFGISIAQEGKLFSPAADRFPEEDIRPGQRFADFPVKLFLHGRDRQTFRDPEKEKPSVEIRILLHEEFPEQSGDPRQSLRRRLRQQELQ